jgi:hypothetical protein
VIATFSSFAATSGASGGTHVYRSVDAGLHWQDISAGLPDSPVNSVIRHPLYPNVFFVGADAGFFLTTDGGASWQQFQTNLPNSVIDQLFTDGAFTTLFAATHGRGMFSLPTSSIVIPAPILNVTTGSLVFSATAGLVNFSSQAITLSTNPGVISWTATTAYSSTAGNNVNWLNLSAVHGAVFAGTPLSINVGANSQMNLAAGTYTATVTISNDSNQTAPIKITVVLNVHPAALLQITPSNLVFNAYAAQANPSPQTLVITTAYGTLGWIGAITNYSSSNGSTNNSWLSLSPNSGTVSVGNPANVSVGAFTTNLPVGVYTATLVFTDTSNPADIVMANVTAQVAPAIPASISIVAGSPQSTVISTTFSTSLQVIVVMVHLCH